MQMPVLRINETSTKYFIIFFNYFGIKLSNEKNIKFLRSYIIVIAGGIQMILALWLSVICWDNINVRVAAFTKFGEYTICTLALGNFVLNPQHCIELFKLTDNVLDYLIINWTKEQLFIRNNANKRAKTIQKLYFVAGITLWFFTNFVPSIIEISKLIIKPLEDISENELFTSFYFIPYLTPKTISIYSILSLFQSFLYLIMITTTAVYYSVVTTSIKMLEAEVKILCESVKIVANKININLNASNIKETHSNKYLEDYSKRLIKHHQFIINAVSKLNEVAAFLLIAFNGIITAQLSLELYCTLETDEPWMHFLRMPGSVVCYGIMCFLGQGLINEADNIRKELEFFPWVDTPLWFKKHLLIMITAAKKPLQIRPSNLFVLNAHNFMSVIQAAYSYLNMMRSFKANRGF